MDLEKNSKVITAWLIAKHMDTKKTKEKEEFLDESPEGDDSVEFLDDEFEEDEDEEKS
jgi:hypothetical protein